MSGIFGKLKAEIDKLGEPENRFSLRNLACVLSHQAHPWHRMVMFVTTMMFALPSCATLTCPLQSTE